MKKLLYLFQISLAILVAISLQNCSESDDLQAVDDSIQKQAKIEINQELGTEYEEFDISDLSSSARSGFSFFTFKTLNAALECTGLSGALQEGRKTLYAPSDAAFAQAGLNESNICALGTEALTAILLYHVAEGNVSLGKVGCLPMLDNNETQLSRVRFRRYINESRIYLKWRQSSLRIYAINSVLSPPEFNIVQTAQSASQFSVLVQAVLAANPVVASALSNPDATYTVLAPTNQAFLDLLGALNLSSLNDLIDLIGPVGLTNVLLYHVVETCAFSNDLKNGQTLNTLLPGETLKVDLRNFSIQDTSPDPAGLDKDGLDIRTTNGVIHTIEKVLLPSFLTE